MTYVHDVRAARARFAEHRRTERAKVRKKFAARKIAEAKHALRSAPAVMLQRAIRSAWLRARRRAKRHSLPFKIKLEVALTMAEQSGYRCALTGLEFCLTCSRGWYHQPFLPSVDRIDSGRGYEKDNVRLVLNAVNVALGEWGEDIFKMIVTAYFHRQSFGQTPRILDTPVSRCDAPAQ